MRKRPWPIIILAVLHALAPLGNIFFNSLLSKVPVAVFWRALWLPDNRGTLLIFTLVPILGAILIYLCKKWSYYLYIALMTLPFYFSFVEYLRKSTPLMAVALILFFVVNIVVVGYFLLPAVRRLYFDPRMRWWETKPRYQADFQCQVEFKDQQHWVEIKNISEGGAFLETSADFSEGDSLKLFFKDPQGVIALRGDIVYRRTTAPSGYGFKFDKASSKEPRLHEVIKKLETEGAIIQSRMPAPEETFAGWLKTLLASGNKKST